MNDLSLLLGNSMIGLLLLGMWYADRERDYFAYWGIGHIFTGIAAIIGTFLRMPDALPPSARLLVFTVGMLSTGLGLASMIGGALRYRQQVFSWRDSAILAVGFTALVFGIHFAYPPGVRWLICIGIAFTMWVVAWSLWRPSLLERFAAVAFMLRGVNGILMMVTTGWFINPPHAAISHLLALFSATCLLLAVFQRKSEELEHRNELLTFSNRLITALQSTSDERNLAEEALRQLSLNMPNQRAMIHLMETDGAWLELIAIHGHTPEVTQLVQRMPADLTLSGQALRLRKTVCAQDYANEPGAWQVLADAFTRGGIVANVSVPLLIDNLPLGVLNISYPQRSEITQHEIETLQSAGQVISTCLDRVRHVRDLAYRANHDSLTGLGNRDALHHCVEAMRLDQHAGIFAMLLIDIDHFKEVNDALGHKTGDLLLCKIAELLRGALYGKQGQAFRLGGDEFAVLLPHLVNEDDGHDFARNLTERLGQRVQIANTDLRVDASIGLAFSPRHSTSSHELLRCADVAMYRAKHSGGRTEVYARSHDPHSAERLELLARIPEAIRREEFVLHYQPQLDLHNHRLVACEALIRWQHPDRGLLPPGEFIPLAEVSDVIRPLTEWIIDTAMAQASAWQDNRLPLRVAFNLSARNILDPGFTAHLLQAVEEHGLMPGSVELELTETVLLHDPGTSAVVLEDLARRGFVLALDDFGTGYSSLSYLKQYPFSILKIDRSFVSDMHQASASLEIVRSTIQLAHALGMKVVAEGVEDEAALISLRNLGCDYAQGYFIGRPMAAEGIAKWQKEAPVLRVAG